MDMSRYVTNELMINGSLITVHTPLKNPLALEEICLKKISFMKSTHNYLPYGLRLLIQHYESTNTKHFLFPDGEELWT